MLKLDDLKTKSILLLGLGVEGLSTLKFLRDLFPTKSIGVADLGPFERLDAESREFINSDASLVLHLGEDYLSNLDSYDVVIKTPGVSIVKHPEIQRAIEAGRLTSHTSLFFANCPGSIIGVTGTKGKGTTCKLIYSILQAGGLDAHLVGNIGNPPLPLLKKAGVASIFVFELSAQQLETLEQSPHIAVLLNIVPDHLDHFVRFDNYVSAKQNLTRYQSDPDFLIYNVGLPLPRRIANESHAQLIPCSLDASLYKGYFIEGENIVAGVDGGAERVISLAEISAVLPGRFNLYNVIPAVAAAKLLGVDNEKIVAGIRNFKPEEHRFDRVGGFHGITFYNASIATVPEVTIEHLSALGDDVQTMLLGGYDRGMDFGVLADRILDSQVRTLILFPETGRRIWETLSAKAADKSITQLPNPFFLDKASGPEGVMREAVRLAYLHTEPGKICLHSPASPSFGIFKNYKQRGELFKRFVNEIGTE